MTEEKEEKQEDKDSKKEEDWTTPYCTKAASAEHARAEDEDEPCDDARATLIEEEKEDD